MTRVLVVWEDAHCESLSDLVKRAVRVHGAPDAVVRPTVVRHTSRGNGAFSRYVRYTWPLARARGVPLVQTELRRLCRPHPSEVPDASFTNTFRRPLSCLQLVRQACKLGQLDKNDVAIDDAVSALARESLPTLLARVPDLARLVSLIWSLHQGEPELGRKAVSEPEAAPEPKAVPEAKAVPVTLPAQRSMKKSRRAKGATPSKRKRS